DHHAAAPATSAGSRSGEEAAEVSPRGGSRIDEVDHRPVRAAGDVLEAEPATGAEQRRRAQNHAADLRRIQVGESMHVVLGTDLAAAHAPAVARRHDAKRTGGP